MDKEDKQIIKRATKETWRIGDRTRLKRLLEKNLILYRENEELEQKLEQTEKDLADYQFNYPTIKELEKENAELKKQIEKLKTDLDNAIVSASKWYVGDPVYSMLVDIYNDNFELKEIEK